MGHLADMSWGVVRDTEEQEQAGDVTCLVCGEGHVYSGTDTGNITVYSTDLEGERRWVGHEGEVTAMAVGRDDAIVQVRKQNISL